VDRAAHAYVGAAAAQVGHRGVDLAIGRLRMLAQERHRGEDLSALAVAALRHLVIDPCLLHRMQPRARGEAFDRRDAAAGQLR
jgi:hypothetical protein